MAVQQVESGTRLTPERWFRIEAIFHAVLECGLEQRSGVLAELCNTDVRLRAEVEALLRAEEPARGFLAHVIDDLRRTLSDAGGYESESSAFRGNERFVLRAKIGSGGFGTVYEAYDREQDDVVALKTLDRAGAIEVMRFKREFRSLVGVAHPNLVPLYELLCEQEHWFFTMELVRGTNFLRYVYPERDHCDVQRLRSSLAQLACGVNALHESGRLHCDLKPSNVLVTMQGGVRIVDFGLVSGTSECGVRSLAGTPPYMAPERRATGRSTMASDWYSIGVMLYQALTGRLPGEEPDCGILEPEDLGQLCGQLLDRDPGQRPTGAAVLKLLNASGEVNTALPPENPFVGRESELASLDEAFRRAEGGKTVAVSVTGGSGTGKTALVQYFLQTAAKAGDVLTLCGRCYEQESVPYNAVDEMVDMLASHLARLPSKELRELIDAETALAARLFPVLEPFAPQAERGHIESQELQQAAFGAFRTLLKRLSERWRLVIHLDDLHWANADSLQLLTELLRTPRPAAMLLIVSYRSDCRDALAEVDEATDVRIELEQLPRAESAHLASLLVPAIPHREAWVARIAAESSGNPFLLGELAQYARTVQGAGIGGEISVDRLLQARFSALPQPARQLLEVLSIAGHPVELSVAWRAAQNEGAQQSALALLRARRLVQIRRMQDRQEIEIYHDRLRVTVEEGLQPDARKQRHLELAIELERSPASAPESLAIHFQEGGDAAKTFRYAVAAADAAARSLAFESAARWCRLALSVEDNHEIRVRLADALSSSGRGKDAADTYFECSLRAGPSEQIDLLRRAATDLLISGHTQEGLGALEDVLRRTGLKAPAWGRRAIPSLLANRAWILLHGIPCGATPAKNDGAREMERADVCWSVIRGFGMVDTIRAAEFHSRYFLETLRLGDPYRSARALCVEAGYRALSGERSRGRVEQLLSMASELASDCGNPHGGAMVALVSGMAAFLAGRWAEACRSLEVAERLLRETCAGVAWELATSRLMGSASSYFLGEVKKLSERLPVLLQNARSRGDLYESTMEIRIAHVVSLAADRAGTADATLRAASALLPKTAFYTPHWWALIAGIEIAIYAGDPAAAWSLIGSQWRSLQRSLLMRSQYIRIESLFHRARAALAMAAQAPQQRKRFLRLARNDASAIDRLKAHWGTPVSQLILAGAAEIEGNTEMAVRLLEAAETGLRGADMYLFATAARRRRGLLTGGEEGRGLAAEADAWMQGQNIRNPERMTAMLAVAR